MLEISSDKWMQQEEIGCRKNNNERKAKSEK